MINAANAITDIARHESPAETPRGESPTIRKLFMALHGAYGNLFVSKFSTGERDSSGKDKGIRSAMMVWDAALSKYPADVIESAWNRLAVECPEFPPNLPQFEAVCKAIAPRKTYAEESGLPPMLPAPAPSAAPVSFSRRDDGKDWARKIVARAESGEKVPSMNLRLAREALSLELAQH